VTEIEESILVTDASSGDQEAFLALADACKETVARIAYYVVGNRDEAEDVTSEAFLKAWMSLGTKKNDVPFRIWVSRIAKNAAIDRLRRRRPIPIDPDTNHHDEPEEILDVRRELMLLPVDMRLPVIMMYYDDMSIADIAKVMHIPEGTVKSRIHNAKERMRKRLGND
jgi:RNA polymerase sigma-70 factor (ECF subfamily)